MRKMTKTQFNKLPKKISNNLIVKVVSDYSFYGIKSRIKTYLLNNILKGMTFDYYAKGEYPGNSKNILPEVYINGRSPLKKTKWTHIAITYK